MNIYISGISGTGMGPLALVAKKAGNTVFGSDLTKGAVYKELKKAGIEVAIGEQDGEFLRQKLAEGVDWFVYTSALPENHPEILVAKDAAVRMSKRDELTAWLVNHLGLKMVAVAGTHGKTTTTAMIVWIARQLRLPVAYIVGTTLGFAPSGDYHKRDEFFVYEADEYDRNFLKFHPWVSAVTNVSYDHPDIYKNKRAYKSAFLQFETQTEYPVMHGDDESMWDFKADEIKLAGEARRKDARLAIGAVTMMLMPFSELHKEDLIRIVNDFPGVGRRFERLNDGVYTDYAHHPEEVAATMEIAQEEAKLQGKKGVVVVYQPHQNTRQHEVRRGYKKAFKGAEKVFWLPTYLTRENPELPVLTPEELIAGLANSEVAEAAELSDEFAERLREYVKDGYLVILMTAGPADEWMRKNLG